MKNALKMFLAAMVGMSVTVAVTQVSPDKAKKSDEILAKARQLDLLNHMLPLLLTKPQIDKLLVVVEKSRAKVDQIRSMEHSDLLKYETKINDAVQKGIEKDLVPAKALLVELAKLFQAFTIRRQIAAGENADMVLEVMKKELNAGQLKAAMNSHDIKAFDPNIDVSKLTDDDKLKFYIKDVILDPQGYDLLLKMSKAGA
jgi:hypothetical protein